jgi:pyridoxal phosphate enzyme (YggS family)
LIDVAANVATILERIARAAEKADRDPAQVRLVAAAKKKDAAMIDAAIAAGVADIGENYVREAEARKAEVSGTARWHMIGHLQKNKVRKAVELFDLIQTVDDAELGAEISRRGAALQRVVRVLVEVNLANEPTKSGVPPARLSGIVDELRALSHLSVDGLMTIPPPGSAEQTRPFFRRLRELRDQLALRELSMGMSDDFDTAIEEGATMVRVGRAIFGARH